VTAGEGRRGSSFRQPPFYIVGAGGVAERLLPAVTPCDLGGDQVLSVDLVIISPAMPPWTSHALASSQGFVLGLSQSAQVLARVGAPVLVG
jgi:hypothetical protein